AICLAGGSSELCTNLACQLGSCKSSTGVKVVLWLTADRYRDMLRCFGLILWATWSSQSVAQTTLTVAGSSTVYPVVSGWASVPSIQSAYSLTVEGGGSSTGARRVCAPYNDSTHVDIGTMSRNWRDKEAVRLDDGYTLECKATKQRVTQIQVGVDGLAVVAAKNSAGHNCLTATLGGLTRAQLRWMFSDYSNSQLASGGVDLSSVVPNDDGDNIKEWSDLHADCEEVPINAYGPGTQSGTHDFFAEVVLSDYEEPENFAVCAHNLNVDLESKTTDAEITTFIQTLRPVNCYMESEDDEKILHWVLKDHGGIAYFGFAYYSTNSATLTVARIAEDQVKGVADTLDAKVEPNAYSITDGSYAVFRRSLFMNVDNSAWERAHAYLAYGFTDAGQQAVANVGYVAVNANLRNKMEQRIAEKGNAQADYVPVPPSMCWNGTELFEEAYTNEFGNPKVRYSCQPCQAGFYKQLNTPTKCDPCQAGSVTSEAGQPACEFCLPGTYALQGSTNCSSCAKNSIAAAPGAGRCDACAAGYQTETTGSSACLRCGLGTYRTMADDSCLQCPAGLTTAFMAAENLTDCVCEAKSYKTQAGQCAACPRGMSCAVGSDIAFYNRTNSSYSVNRPYPQLLPGFYSTREEPLSVYKCKEEDVCLGGDPESCEGGLVDLVCSRCPDGQERKDGGCEDCEASGFLIVILGGVAGLCGVIVMHVLTNWPLVKGNRTVMTAVYFGGMAATVVLTFGVYGTLDSVWGPPMSTFIPSFGLLRMDMDFLSFSCVTGRKSFIAEYVVKLFAFPITVCAVIFGSFILSLIPKLKRYASFNASAVVNSAGFLMSALFVSVSLMSLEGFRCKSNPNGKSILQAFGAMVCWEGGEHNTLVILSVFAILLFPVMHLTLTGYASLCFGPLSVKYGLKFTNAVRFLTGRMQPDYVMFSFWWNVRNFLVSLAPVLASSNYGAQVTLILAVFVLWLIGQSKTQCWRFDVLNLLDTVVSGLQIMMLCFFGLLASDDTVDRAMIGWCIIAIFTATLWLLIALAGYKVVNHLRKRSAYDVFLTHHKAAAALSARHLKTLFNMCTTLNVFLDVDELDNLDNLSFAVKHTRKLLVMLTSDVLRRPWCAVEIGTAYLNKVPLRVVQINADNVDLSDDFITDVVENFTAADKGIFAKAGITVQDLHKAYQYLATMSRTTFYLNIPDETMQLDSVMKAAGKELLGFMKKPKVVPLDSEKVVYIVFNTRDDFQCSVAFQLRHLFRQQGWNSILFCGSSGFHQRSRSRIYDGPEELQGNFSELLPIKQKAVAVVLMSKGLPWDPIAVSAAATIKRTGMGVLTVLSQESFWKPEEDYYQDLQDGKIFSPEELNLIQAIAPGCHTEELASALGPLYKILAWAVSPEQNQNLLRQEFSIVQERALKEYSRRAIKVEEQGTYASGCYPPGSSVEVPSVSEKSEKSERVETTETPREAIISCDF
ncbi:unnamed protein product, partial [Durusdinium trenchii]